LAVPVPLCLVDFILDLGLDPARGCSGTVTAAWICVPVGVVEAVLCLPMTTRSALWWAGVDAPGHIMAQDIVHYMGEGVKLGVAVGKRVQVQS
jgi:hypothetical protein